MSGLRILRWLLIPALVLPAGCVSWRSEEPIRVPDGLASFPGIADLKTGLNRNESLRKLFPPITEYIVSTRVTAERRRFWVFHGKALFDISLISGQERLLRMAGRHPGDATTVFDLSSDGNRMQVYLPLANQVYQGEIPSAGTPFASQLGVEPWELAPVFAFGQRLAEDPMTWIAGSKGETLVPSGAGGQAAKREPGGAELEKVEMDAATGLPRKAYWKRGSNRWQVEYLAWGITRYPEGSEPGWLLPAHLKLTCRKPRVTLDIVAKDYRVNPKPDARRWSIRVPSGARIAPLPALKDGLKTL